MSTSGDAVAVASNTKLDFSVADAAIQCPFCLEMFTKPKLLSCGHTFCQPCLEQLAASSRQSAVGLACPLCMTEVLAPEAGLSQLPSNAFVEKLMSERRNRNNSSSSSSSSSPRQNLAAERNIKSSICVGVDERGVCLSSTAAAASKHSPGHHSSISLTGHKLHNNNSNSNNKNSLKLQRTTLEPVKQHSPRTHDHKADAETAASTEAVNREVETSAASYKMTPTAHNNSSSNSTDFCPEHPTRPLNVYCKQCEEPACETCFIVRHNGHSFGNIVDIGDSFRQQLNEDIKQLTIRLSECRRGSQELDNIRPKMVDSSTTAERQIADVVEGLKQDVDGHAVELRQQLTAWKMTQTKTLNCAMKDIRLRLVRLQEFVQRCEQFKDTSSLAALSRDFRALHQRATELFKQNEDELAVAAVNRLSLSPRFCRTSLRSFLPPDKYCLVGTLHLTSPESTHKLMSAAQTKKKKKDEEDTAAAAAGSESVGWNRLMEELQLAEQEREKLEKKAAATTTQLQRKLGESQKRQLQLKKQIKRISLKSTLVQTLNVVSSTYAVRGIALLDGNLYVLRVGTKSTDIAVYDTDSFNLDRRLTVPRLRAACDLVSSDHDDCLFVADLGTDLIHRVDSDGTCSAWPVDDKPRGLSMTSNAGVLVTCFIKPMLREFSSRGELLRQVDLDASLIGCAWHAVEFSADRYVVFHASRTDPSYKLCIVDGEGHAVSDGSYTELGWSTSDHMDCPVHLAVDTDGFVFVLDGPHKRVLLLDEQLQRVREVLSPEHGLTDPRTVCWDGESNKLYVAEGPGNVFVYELI